MKKVLNEIDRKISEYKDRQPKGHIYKGGPQKYDNKSIVMGLTMAWDIVAQGMKKR